MIKRYSRKELTDIWSEKNTKKIRLAVEKGTGRGMYKRGQIEKGV